MSNPFSSPGSSEKIIVDDNIGKLFLITPKEIVDSVKTVHGDKEAIVVDAVILDRDGKGKNEVYTGVMIFSGVLIGKLKSAIGKPMPVLAVLAKGEAKKGQSAPWTLNSPSDADVKVGVKYWESLQTQNPFA